MFKIFVNKKSCQYLLSVIVHLVEVRARGNEEVQEIYIPAQGKIHQYNYTPFKLHAQ